MWNIPYPVLIVVNDSKNTPKEWSNRLYHLTGEMMWHIYEQPYDGFEVGAIRAALDKTKWEEFILLQDTIEIKDKNIFKVLFEEFKGQSVAYNPHFQMYLGKYRRVILEQMTLPQVRNKIEAVREEEGFTREYQRIDPDTKVFNPDFRDENFYTCWEEMFGRTNMKMEDDYIIKRKATWSADQL